MVGIWIRRLQAYRWIEQYHTGKVKHTGNLCRTCRRLGISSPQSHSPAQILAGIEACTQHLADLKKIAPQLRKDHMRACLVSARDRDDTPAIKALQNILRTESIRRRWRSIRHTVNPNRGGAVARLKVPHESGDILYSTRDGVEWQAAEAIAARYKGIYYSCPFWYPVP